MRDYFSFHYSSYPVKATMGQLLIAAQYPSLVLENMKCLSLCVQGGAPVPGRALLGPPVPHSSQITMGLWHWGQQDHVFVAIQWPA